MKKWKILKSEDVSLSPWMKVFKHKVELPSKIVIDDYYTADFDDGSMVVAFTREGDIVLVQQYKQGIQEICIELPAGLRHKNATFEDAAIAELEEETGIKVHKEDLHPLGKIVSLPTKTNFVTHAYLVKDVAFNSKQSLDVTEEIEVLTKKPQEVLAMVRSGEIWAADTVAVLMRAYLMFPALFN